MPRASVDRAQYYIMVDSARYLEERGRERLVLWRRNNECKGCCWVWVLVSHPPWIQCFVCSDSRQLLVIRMGKTVVELAR